MLQFMSPVLSRNLHRGLRKDKETKAKKSQFNIHDHTRGTKQRVDLHNYIFLRTKYDFALVRGRGAHNNCGIRYPVVVACSVCTPRLLSFVTGVSINQPRSDRCVDRSREKK